MTEVLANPNATRLPAWLFLSCPMRFSSCTIFCSPDRSHSFQIHLVQFCHILFCPTLSHPILPFIILTCPIQFCPVHPSLFPHVSPPCGLATCEGICAPAEPDPFPCMPIPFSVKNSSRSMYCSWNRPPSQGSVRSHSSGPRNADCELGRSAPEP